MDFRHCFLLALGLSSVLGMSSAEEFDASDITWAHAVNSRDQLEKALAGPFLFLEADVSWGLLKGSEFGTYIPIMAHPPDQTSDMSLDDWMTAVVSSNTSKGIKLDFKSLEAVEPSLLLLKEYKNKNNLTLWLNADILPGPFLAKTTPIDASQFLLHCFQLYPEAVLSIGWTTEWYPVIIPTMWRYEWSHVVKMANTIRCFDYQKRYPSFTFPVRAIYASRSIRQLNWLLTIIPKSSLTVWSAKGDPLELSDLIRIRKSFPMRKVYYDIPDRIDSFAKVKNNVTYQNSPRVQTHEADRWITLSRGERVPCLSFTYITEDTIVFGKSSYSAAILKKPITVDEHSHLTIEGFIDFFDLDSDQSEDDHQLTMVIVDVSRFSKNLTAGSLDLTTSDTDILWSAVNASQMYTFKRGDYYTCWMFKLDTSQERTFRTWNLLCEDIDGQASLDEAQSVAKEDTPSKKILVLPKSPFMIGFISEGKSSVIVHDFKIRENVGEQSTSRSSSLTQISLAGLCVMLLSLIISIL